MSTTNTTSSITQAITAPLVAVGISEDALSKAHLWGMLFYGAFAGYIFGVYRGKQAPASNFLGL